MQGDVREHQQVLTDLGAEVVLVRTPAQLEAVSGLVIPGGESSVIDKLSRIFDIAQPIRERIAAGMPVFGTCAGLIMLADTVVDAIRGQQSFGGLDVSVRRNAFGSQNQSFETQIEVPELGGPAVHATFIRGPVVDAVGSRARVMAALPDGRVVAVAQGNLLGTSFHPEMNGETRFHRYFLDRVAEQAG
ncbi:glutamine amidotransferase for pyridoxal phosphate synthesis; pyridoxal 5'-phosphate synthase complex, glutamine amidotransferase subunit PdxT [Pseudoclavibacter sp. 8L]|nr:glutamine amidotransferase for pyridoxal phosphate synthesis; pyridoxal 5'-phosphate synthase complex, glutamine amidotransferase subunit PdxT [Pseudoclavibacter sp. 8L]